MANKLRVLCLHGYGQDGDAFRAKSGSCRKDSKKLAEFEFVTSPQHIEPGAGPGAGHPDHADDGSDPGRFWWDFNSEANQMRGFDETVAFLAQVFEERGPFDGVLAFSQGAGLLAILMAMLQRGELPAAITFRFGCLVSGFHPRDTTYRAVLDAQPLTIPSLHIYGDTDGIIVPEKSKDLAAAWEPGAATVLTHSGGHLMPSAAPVRKGLKQFLQAQLEAGGGSPPTAQRKKPVHTKQMQKAPKPKPEPSAAAAAPVAAAASPSPSGGGSGERPWRVSFVRGGRVGAAAWSVRLARAAAPSRVAWPALNEHATNDQLREALVAAQQKLQQLAERVELLESSPAPTSLPQAPAPAPAPAPTKATSKGGDGGGSASELSFRAVVMRCDSCSLLVDNKDEWVHIGPGFIIGLCFLKGASAQGGTVRKAVQTFLSMPIGEKEGQGAGKLAGTPCTIAEAGANEVMVVPQASLAGKMKNKRMQYHNACKKDLGEELYHDFCEVMAKELEVVKHGTYGNTQGLKLSAACGPFTSYFEF
jgi:D-Tyr-tRNAtyr deacylase/predicted esterase